MEPVKENFKSCYTKDKSRGLFIIKLMELNFKDSSFLLSPSRALEGPLAMCSYEQFAKVSYFNQS